MKNILMAVYASFALSAAPLALACDCDKEAKSADAKQAQTADKNAESIDRSARAGASNSETTEDSIKLESAAPEQTLIKGGYKN